ncbi:MAG: type I restriction enzyme HsdR N-terminal domain-containing protein [Chitinophagaceae bacterium]|nr:MAG: type I restriction enzyme HsdR N-terminal domain-containing protein [Chitinophagaceae bacterium]
MIKIMYPQYSYKIKEENGKEVIFDPARKSWVRLTPEEWVRQNFLQYLLQVMNYPASLVAVEKELQLGELKKRFDLLVYDRKHKPWMMIECKSMDVELDEAVLSQILRYHIAIPVPFLVVTNGAWCSAFEKMDGKLKPLEILPAYDL